MKEKLQARVALVIIAVAALLLFFRYPMRHSAYHAAPPTDFAVYLKASERVGAGMSPYVLSDPSPYKYSPGVLGLVNLLPKDPPTAWLIYSALCVLGLAIALIVGARYNTWGKVLLLLLGIGISWKGILETLDYGQIEILILVAAVIAASLRIRHPVIAGLIAGSLPWFKLPWILLGLPMVLTPVQSLTGPGRKPKRVRLFISGYFFAWFVWGAAIPRLTFGTERAMVLFQEWITILRAQPAELFLSDVNQSFWVTALRWFGQSKEVAFGLVALSGGLLLGSLTARTLKITPSRDVFTWLSPWLLLVQLLNPLSWRWGSVFLIGVPFAIAGMSAKLGRNILRSLLMIAALGLWLMTMNPVVKALGYHHWSDFHGYGLVTALWLSLLLLCLEPSEYWQQDRVESV